MNADEDAKDKLSAINDFGDSAVMGRTPRTVIVEKVKVCEVCQTEPCKIKFFSRTILIASVKVCQFDNYAR